MIIIRRTSIGKVHRFRATRPVEKTTVPWYVAQQRERPGTGREGVPGAPHSSCPVKSHDCPRSFAPIAVGPCTRRGAPVTATLLGNRPLGTFSTGVP
jgi:hypothetical protein